MSANAQEWLGLFPGDPSVNGELPLPIHSVAFAALVRLYERSVLRVRLVNGAGRRYAASGLNPARPRR
jgi:hypothetical protein